MTNVASRESAPTKSESESDSVGVTIAAGRYLTFLAGGETYAVDILQITEIIEFKKLTVVPMMPPFVRGVINLRGRVLPVVDLASRFGRKETGIARRTSIIVIESRDHSEGQGIGIMVDAVNKVTHFDSDVLQPPPAFGGGIRTEFIGGMARLEEDFIIVLDISAVLAADEIETFQAQVSAPGHLESTVQAGEQLSVETPLGG